MKEKNIRSKEGILKTGKYIEIPARRIIRHKTSKQKWRLRTKSGKEIICTNDHSLMVVRNGVLIECKPCDLKSTDKFICLKE